MTRPQPVQGIHDGSGARSNDNLPGRGGNSLSSGSRTGLPQRNALAENILPQIRTGARRSSPAPLPSLGSASFGGSSHLRQIGGEPAAHHSLAEVSLPGYETSDLAVMVRADAPVRELADGARAAEMDTWRRGLRPDSQVDVKDTVDKWCEATILAVDRAHGRVYVTYKYWARTWDEWIRIDDPALAPPGTRTYQPGGPLRLGHRVEALDEKGQWLHAEVVEESPDGRARLHFMNFHEKFDKWVWPSEKGLRQFGPLRATAKNGRSSRKVSIAQQQHIRQIAQLSTRYEQYSRALGMKGLRVEPVEGDGNCLFRSVSHQVYGDQKFHALVRARCMDYMESEAHFFEPYVEGDVAAFQRYVAFKRQNAVWGDDPEVQALCEIYDRPAEIWAYDPQLGAKTLRTFHETNTRSSGHDAGRRPPMRLSYYGGGHYDSVASVDHPIRGAGSGSSEARGHAGLSPGLVEPTPEPGQLEDAALERSRRRAARAFDGRWDPEEMKGRRDDECLSEQAEQAVMDHALACSRNVFEAQFDDLDSALVASVDHMERSNLNSLKAASRDSELVMLQEEMLRTAQAQSEEEQLRNALEASCNTAAAAAAEADMVRHAIAESMAATGAGVDEAGTAPAPGAPAGTTQEHELWPAVAPVAEDDDQELRRALLLSGKDEGWDMPQHGAGHREGFDVDDLQEDPELSLAIEASLASS